jgi:hypothetical protein
MTVLNGVLLAEWYKNKCEKEEVHPSPIILLSTYTVDYFKKYDLPSLGIVYMSKPVCLNQLKGVLKRF